MNRIVQRQGAAPPWVEIQGGECRGNHLPTCTDHQHSCRTGICHSVVPGVDQTVVDKARDTDADN